MSQQIKRLKYHALSCGISSTSVLSKADEYCRMVDAKGLAFLRQLNFIGESKLILCLEIAASELGQSVDKKICVERSGMASRNYQSALRSIKALLSLQKQVSVRECAVTLGCPQLADAASTLVKQYLQKHLGGDHSLVSSAVNMAAISVVARKEGITLKASKVSEMASCNKSSFMQVKSLMEQLSLSGLLKETRSEESKLTSPLRSSPRKRKALTAVNGGVVESSCERSDLFERSSSHVKSNDMPSDSDSFLVWKGKIIANAKRQLKIIT